MEALTYKITNECLDTLNRIEFLFDEVLKAYLREKFIPPDRPCEVGTDNFEAAFMHIEYDDEFFRRWHIVRFCLSNFRLRYIMWTYHRNEDKEDSNVRRSQMKSLIKQLKSLLKELEDIFDISSWSEGILTYLNKLDKTIAIDPSVLFRKFKL